MTLKDASILYRKFTKYKTQKGKELLIVGHLGDPETETATALSVVDLYRQMEVRIDLQEWEDAIKYSKIWRIPEPA